MLETTATPELLDAPPPPQIEGLRVIQPGDLPALIDIFQHMLRVREVWDDAARANPGLWFMQHYTNPYNLVFDVCDGGGFIAFLKTIPGWRAQVYYAAWEKRAMRRYDLRRAAAKIAMLAHDLIVIDGFTKTTNRRAILAAHRAGMRHRGRIKNAIVYNGNGEAVEWFEIDRADLGLPPVE